MQHEICYLDAERQVPADRRGSAANREVVRFRLQEHPGVTPHVKDHGDAKIEEQGVRQDKQHH